MRRAIVAACSLASVALAQSSAALLEADKQQRHAHEAVEHRVGKDWNYIPNYGMQCDGVGCCGAPTPEKPQRQACGPEFWRYLNADTNVRCVAATGGQQTPINFQTVGNDTLSFTDMYNKTGADEAGKKNATLAFSDQQCVGKLEFLANTWEVVFDKNCTLHVDVLGKRWKLKQYHLHNAEHAVNGMYYPLEVHMVHQTEQNETLVIGLFITPGPNSRFFDQVTHPDAEERLKPLDPYEIVPKDGKYWHYTGSLTTPPCQTKVGAVVQWFVMQTPITIAADQMFTFTSYFANLEKAYNGRVNRPLQDVLKETNIYESHEEPAAPASPSRRRRRNRIGNIRG